jgi:REP element-mobilizing transposase RayT
MARPLRLEFPGAVYHLTSRGNARQNIFFTDADRELYLSTLAGVVRRYRWICHAYCLMANHYHLLIETPKANLSIGMRQLNGIYTQSFNRRNQRVGHLFQGRFKAILVEKEAHLLELCRYVVLNPVRVKGGASAQSWKWKQLPGYGRGAVRCQAFVLTY